jgi:uncharacterized membrane protein (DUF485 family)
VVVLALVGVAGFLVIGRPSGGSTHVSFSMFPPLAAGLVVVVGGCLAVAARSRSLRPFALALACGVSYGVAAFLVKLLTSEFGGGPVQVFTHWPVFVFAVAGPAGFILNQDAFQQGRFLAPVQAIITTADPVISIAFSVIWLNVRLRSSPAGSVGEVVAVLLVITGIVITARYAPLAAGHESVSTALGASAEAAGLPARSGASGLVHGSPPDLDVARQRARSPFAAQA